MGRPNGNTGKRGGSMKLWIVRDIVRWIDDETPLYTYWSNMDGGWTGTVDRATAFTTRERDASNLPIGNDPEWMGLPRK